jgi:hypothetical protein
VADKQLRVVGKQRRVALSDDATLIHNNDTVGKLLVIQSVSCSAITMVIER